MIDNPHTEFMLAALRAASARCKLWDNEITAVGVALRHDMIGPEMAVKWINDLGLMFLIEPLPGVVGQVALANGDGEGDPDA